MTENTYTLSCSCGEVWTSVKELAELYFWEMAHGNHKTSIIHEKGENDGAPNGAESVCA